MWCVVTTNTYADWVGVWSIVALDTDWVTVVTASTNTDRVRVVTAATDTNGVGVVTNGGSGTVDQLLTSYVLRLLTTLLTTFSSLIGVVVSTATTRTSWVTVVT